MLTQPRSTGRTSLPGRVPPADWVTGQVDGFGTVTLPIYEVLYCYLIVGSQLRFLIKVKNGRFLLGVGGRLRPRCVLAVSSLPHRCLIAASALRLRCVRSARSTSGGVGILV